MNKLSYVCHESLNLNNEFQSRIVSTAILSTGLFWSALPPPYHWGQTIYKGGKQYSDLSGFPGQISSNNGTFTLHLP